MDMYCIGGFAVTLALSKLSRNAGVDAEDVKHLARGLNFALGILADRYRRELRPFLTRPISRHDLTLKLWIEAITEERESRGI